MECIATARSCGAILTYTIDGKPAGDADRATMIQAYQAPNRTVIHVPFDARYVAEYQYVQSGPRTIAFSSTIQDAVTARDVTYDAAGDVLSYTYQPNALAGTPLPARSSIAAPKCAERLAHHVRDATYKGS